MRVWPKGGVRFSRARGGSRTSAGVASGRKGGGEREQPFLSCLLRRCLRLPVGGNRSLPARTIGVLFLRGAERVFISILHTTFAIPHVVREAWPADADDKVRGVSAQSWGVLRAHVFCVACFCQKQPRTHDHGISSAISGELRVASEPKSVVQRRNVGPAVASSAQSHRRRV